MGIYPYCPNILEDKTDAHRIKDVLWSSFKQLNTLLKETLLCHVQKSGCSIFAFNYICFHDKLSCY